MDEFKDKYKKEKGFECWVEHPDYGSYTDDYVNWLEEQLRLCVVSSSAKYTAETIQALNNTLLANKTIGNYKHIEQGCIEKLEMLISKIE